jgi:gamma-glutamylcyclotransferase (GGCT)/AIG2-like uncharacterized protein YtfP
MVTETITKLGYGIYVISYNIKEEDMKSKTGLRIMSKISKDTINKNGTRSITIAVPRPDDLIDRMIPRRLVFVYGTLLTGHRYHYLLQSSVFINKGVIHGASLYVYDHGVYPCLVYHWARTEGDRVNDYVTGEVWAVDESSLRNIDRLEGYDPKGTPNDNLYDRTNVRVILKSDDTVECLTYIVPELVAKETMNRLERIEDGDWNNYYLRW